MWFALAASLAAIAFGIAAGMIIVYFFKRSI